MLRIDDFLTDNRDILNCLKTAVIKKQKELEYYDTEESRVRFNIYRNARNQTDSIYEYDYEVEEFFAVGYLNHDNIIRMQRFPKDIKLYLTEEQCEKLLENKRKHVLSHYIEENEYVLTLMGYPYQEEDFLYLGYHIDGIRDNIPVHRMSQGEISILTNKGILKKIIEDNPDKEYLNYITRRIPFYVTRTTEAFGLLYIDTTKYNVGYRVAEVYEYMRIAYMKTQYNEYYHDSYDYYEPFTATYLICATMYMILAENPMNILEFDFTSDEILDSLYRTFSIPYVADLPKSVRIAFAEKINRVLRYKGDKSSILNIAEAFGIKDVYQYILYKEYVDFEKGYDPTKSLEENYKLSFVRVPIGAKDLHKFIYNIREGDTKAKIPFDEFVSGDRRWGLGRDKLKEYVMKENFSYVTTKYIGVDSVVSLTENAFTQSEFLSFLFGNKERLGDFKLTLTKANLQASLWDAFVYSMVLIMNKNGYEDDIIKDPEGLVYIYGIDNHFKLTEEVAEAFNSRVPKDMEYLSYYKTVNESMSVVDFLDVLLHNRNALGVLRRMIREEHFDYAIMKELMKLEHMIGTMAINHYYGQIKNYDSYSDYLAVSNPPLYTHLQAMKVGGHVEDDMNEELLSVIEDLYNYCNPSHTAARDNLLSFLSKIKEDEAQTIKTTMFKMIAFLKTYTVDLRVSETSYVFDDYERILSEVLIKNHVWLWDRVTTTTYEEATQTVKMLGFHSYLEVTDFIHRKGVRDRSKVMYPPWVTVPNTVEYLRPDMNEITYDDGFQRWFKEYDNDYIDVFETVPHVLYKVHERDRDIEIHDYAFQKTFKEFEHEYVEPLEILNDKYKWYFWDRYSNLGVKDTITNKTKLDIHTDIKVYDTIRCRETGRLQTDIVDILKR